MSKAALNWKFLSVDQQVTKALTIAKAMNGNANFTNPNPKLADIVTAANDLSAAEKDVVENGGGTKWTTIRDAKEKVLSKLMSLETTYVNNVSGGDAEKIVTAGYELAKEKSKSEKLSSPQGLTATPGNRAGLIKLRWKKVPKSASYKVYISEDTEPLVWKDFTGNTITDSKLEVADLPGGTRRWFMVVAINSLGEGGQSDPAVVRVP